LKTSLNGKTISIAAVLLPVLGIIAEASGGRYGLVLRWIMGFFEPLRLSWLASRHLEDTSRNTLPLIFYGLLLIGGILYLLSKQKETRLIRLVFSLILISEVRALLYRPFEFYFVKHQYPAIPITPYIIGGLMSLFWIWFSYQVLVYFNRIKVLDIEETQYGETVSQVLVTATLWQRVFNVITDWILCIMVFSVLYNELIALQFFSHDSIRLLDSLNNKQTITIMLVILRAIYYLFFEGLFGATPAKFLSETRVIKNDGDPTVFGTIIGRTLVRFVPLDGLSFFTTRGWHDQWSDTSVVREKRTGVKGGQYFWLIPIAIGLWIISYWSVDAYKAFKADQRYKHAEEARVDNLRRKLEKVTSNDFFQVTFINDSYQEDNLFLKAEKIGTGDITFSIVEFNGSQHPSQSTIEDYYNGSKQALSQIKFTKKELYDAISSGQKISQQGKPGGLRINDKHYYINNIETYFMPNIDFDGTGRYGDLGIAIGLVNKGWPMDLIDVKVIEGDIRNTTPFPIHLSTRSRWNEGTRFMLTGSLDKKNIDYKINFTIQDTLGRQQVYQVTGNSSTDENKTLTRIK